MNPEPANRSAAHEARGRLTRVVADARRHLELERSFGLEHVPYRPERVQELRRKRQEALAERVSVRREQKAAALLTLRQELQNCMKCGLGQGRTKLVFGQGDADADLLFIGEAPGFHEDQQGIPFVGRAGQLLTRIIEAIGLTRDQVYIANICKCRPPGNRAPLADEAAACFPFLLQQIEIIRPRIVVTMGNPATQTLLQTREGITRMRGRFTDWQGMEVMPTFHPSYLLRNPAAKRQVWEDMQKVWRRMRELGLPVGPLKGGRA